jgi:hypothetical protein
VGKQLQFCPRVHARGAGAQQRVMPALLHTLNP